MPQTRRTRAALPTEPAAAVRRVEVLGGLELMDVRLLRRSFPPHAHETLMLGVVHRGVLGFARGRARWAAGPGEVALVNPGEAHTGERLSGGEGAGEDALPLAYGSLYVEPRGLEALAEEAGVPRPRVRFAAGVARDPGAWRLLAAGHLALMRAGADRSGDGTLAGEEQLTEGLALLITRHEPGHGRPPALLGTEPAPAPPRRRWHGHANGWMRTSAGL